MTVLVWILTLKNLWLAYINKPQALTHISDKLISHQCQQSVLLTTMLQVLEPMGKLHLKIPLVLAISWNVPELTSNN